jgi:hypothetical protein
MEPIDAAGDINAAGSQDSTLGDLHAIFGGDHPTESTVLISSREILF